jgi:hypothetical protein
MHVPVRCRRRRCCTRRGCAGVAALLRRCGALRRLRAVRCARVGAGALRALAADFPACAIEWE